jgi:hypothetical protein
LPYRLVASAKSLEAGGIELKKRTSTDSRIVSPEKITEALLHP